MAKLNGCDLPEDLYYLIEKHVWAKPMDDGTVRVGMTAVAGNLAGGNLAGVTVKRKSMGKEIPQGKSMATIESSKFVGPVPAPVTGVLLRGNDKLSSDPNLAVSDPYGEGWIAELQPADWDGEKDSLATGLDGLAAYQTKLDADGVSCN
ncbi:MAG: glycine cleavage system protein H [Anaerolineae bacterium]|nr:glycine cleavage system protein H [Anaerolineae bacterium]MBL6966154.1 glycine cleavage system protein H [Anaerolineales bacterium]